MNVALAALDATVHVESVQGKRSIPLSKFHRLPGTTPNLDTNLKPDELITAIELPPSPFSKNSWYLKVRDRQSYAFALVSVAAGLELDGATIKSACLALGGVAHKPWRSLEAEKALAGATPTRESFAQAADIALKDAKGYLDNAFKIQLAKQSIVRAFSTAARGTTAGAEA
jgi:xanthine dehydrogenase YagS FAD-binding subunit